MNNIRRKEIKKVMEKLYEAEGILNYAYDLIAELNAEEDEYRDNIPENLQNGERYEASEEASSYMEYATDALEGVADSIIDAIDYLEGAAA